MHTFFYYQSAVLVPSKTVIPVPIVARAIALDFLVYPQQLLVDRFHQALTLMMVQHLEIVRFSPIKKKDQLNQTGKNYAHPTFYELSQPLQVSTNNVVSTNLSLNFAWK